jgi:hypothetical protein
MSPKSLARRISAVAAVAAPTPAPIQAASRTHPLSSIHAKTLDRAREGAARKLEQPECQRLFEEFRDGEGRTLAQNLAKFERSPADYLRLIPFLDGASHSLCRGGNVFLFAGRGIPRVFVCQAFAKKQISDPFTAENIVIHEVLHTLGLGENPPSSQEITRRVNGRCQ